MKLPKPFLLRNMDLAEMINKRKGETRGFFYFEKRLRKFSMISLCYKNLFFLSYF